MTDYNDGEFHLWHGGECPVHPQTVVEIRFRDLNRIGFMTNAGDWNWVHSDNAFDVVGFRVVKPYRAQVYLHDEIGPDHPAVKAYIKAYMDSSGGDGNIWTANGLNAALKVLREGGE